MARLNSPEELENFRQAILSKKDPNTPCISICAGTGCIASGAGEVITAFKDEISKQNLQAEVNTKETGCPGFCERGPVVVIYPEEICYLQVTPEDVPEIVSQTIKEKKIVERLVYVDPSTDEMGNMAFTFGKGEEHYVFVAHMDEVGFTVESILEDGRGQLGRRSSPWESQAAVVHGLSGDVDAVFEPREGYFSADVRRPPEPLTLYLGTSSREETEALGVEAGKTTVTMPKQMQRMGRHRVLAMQRLRRVWARMPARLSGLRRNHLCPVRRE